MGLDGLFLSTIKEELQKNIILSRVEKINQPSKEEIIITLNRKKLLINASCNNCRINLTDLNIEYPTSPPAFCMILRKYLINAKLIGIEQLGSDRVLYLIFKSISESGDMVNLKLSVEIMGKHSNIILIDQNNNIIDSIKRIYPIVSSVRQVLPHSRYTPPPSQNKLNILETETELILNKIASDENKSLNKKILNTIAGISPIVSKEIEAYALKGTAEFNNNELTPKIESRLTFYINQLKQIITNQSFEFSIILKQNVPKDFTFIKPNNLSTSEKFTTHESPSKLLDTFYGEKDRSARIKQKAEHMLKFIIKTLDRISNRILIQQKTLEQCKEKEKLKVYGELIISNIYQIKKGDKSAIVQDYYNDPPKDIEITLNPEFSPQKNAELYFNKYKKAVRTEKTSKKIIKKSELEYGYIESVLDCLLRCESESEIIEIQRELIDQGYIKEVIKTKDRSTKAKPPIKYVSTDGYTILCGRNNNQNDILTTKQSKKHDIWLHTKNIPGSHVIIVTEGKEVPETTLEQAAIIAVVNSKAKNSSKIGVDYTQIKNVRKPKNSKPGMVIFENYKTIYVDPDIILEKSLKT